MILEGGKKYENTLPFVFHGTPDLSDASGPHGTIQLPLTDDVESIKQSILEFIRGVQSGRDIYFEAYSNNDGTMEVNFEVQL